MRRIPLLAAVAAAAVLVPAAVSQAATVSYSGGALVYSGAGSEANDVLVTTYQPFGEDTTYLAIRDATGIPQTSATSLCHADTSGYGGMLCALDPNRPVKLYGNAGKDRLDIYFSEVPASIPFELHGGDGNDELKDSSGAVANRKLFGDAGDDKLSGYAGDDYLDGGDGQDEVDGGEGNDQVHGGAGNDVMWGDHYADPGADLIDGGAGVDTTQDWSIPSDLDQQPAIDVTLDGKANDGRPGENDNVVGVEKFQMYVVGRLVGSGAAEELNIYNPGNSGPSTLIGNGGNDNLYGHDQDDTVDGGAGNDHVEGGYGNDKVTGGPGEDVIYGDATASRCTWYSCKVPFGNDVIYANDGEADNIDCGFGTDTAYVDALDTVAGCEKIVKGGRAGHGGGSGVSIAVAKTRLRALASKGLKIKVPCASACSVKGTLVLKGKKVGSGRKTILHAGTAKATLKLTPAGRRKLRRMRKATLTIKVAVTPASGATQTGSRKVTLKR